MESFALKDEGFVKLTIGDDEFSIDPVAEYDHLSAMMGEIVTGDRDVKPHTPESRELAKQLGEFYDMAARYMAEKFGLDKVSKTMASTYFESCHRMMRELKKNMSESVWCPPSTDSTPPDSVPSSSEGSS